jgi:hypothetical protein
MQCSPGTDGGAPIGGGGLKHLRGPQRLDFVFHRAPILQQDSIFSTARSPSSTVHPMFYSLPKAFVFLSSSLRVEDYCL